LKDSGGIQYRSGGISAAQIRRFDVRSHWLYDA